MRFSYNAPVVLTMALLAGMVLAIDALLDGWFARVFFATGGLFNPLMPLTMFSHVLGHASWQHFLSNFTLILLVGPLLEEKYGSMKLLAMMLATAAVTALVNGIFTSNAIMGASGIVFMMLIMASITNVKNGEIPITLILAALTYLAGELFSLGSADMISHSAHVIGGMAGGVFGLVFTQKKRIS